MKKDIALVLSSGGARGYAHIGAIKILQQQGFNITSIAGTSMGALIGGIFATGQLPELEDWLLSLDIMEVLKLTDFSISKKGLVKGKKVIDRIRQIVPDRNIEDLLIPYCAVATDIINETEKVFTQGNLFDAIRASIGIPTVFQPKKIDGHYYVDGGLLNPIPVDRIKRHDGDLLVVVDVSSPIPYEKKNDAVVREKMHIKQIDIIQSKLNNLIPTKKEDVELGIFNLTSKSISTMMRRVAELSMEKHQPDLLINISKDSYGTYDFYKAKEIIEEGEKATLKALQQNQVFTL